jgi:hypothetical protein
VQGYDKYDPAKGAPPEAAVLVNENLVKPMFANYAEGAEFDRSINAITRHVIEEFSMFRFFLPEVWERYPQVHPIFNLMDTTTKNWPRLNYGAGAAGAACGGCAAGRRPRGRRLGGGRRARRRRGARASRALCPPPAALP